MKEIAKDCKQNKLGDYFRIKHGWAFKGEFFAESGQYILLTPGNFKQDGGIKLKETKEKYYLGDYPPEYLLKKGDFLVVMTDLTQNAPILGSPAIITKHHTFLHNQRLGKIVQLKENEIDKMFLYHLFNSEMVRSQIKASATGATVKHTAPERIYNVEVVIPPLRRQNKIASILSAYDDLIENNLRRIKILEEMAKTIYDEWFVKFHFPGHEKVRMVESELGLIPEGWSLNRLDQIVSLQNQGTSAGKHLQKLIYLPIDCLPRRSLLVQEIKPWTKAQSSLQLFSKGDIIFGAMRPYFHKVVVAPFDGVTRRTCFVLRSIKPEYHAFCALTMFQDSTVAFANSHSQGATIPYAVWSNAFDGMMVITPTRALILRFQDIVEPMLAEIFNTFFRNMVLRQTRDLLLPRLISGEIDVENLDVKIEE